MKNAENTEDRRWAKLLSLQDVMRSAYSRGGNRLMSVWERDLEAIDWAIELLKRHQ